MPVGFTRPKRVGREQPMSGEPLTYGR